jgi:hypothetical protein
MANEMSTFVQIKNSNKEVSKKLTEIFTPEEGEYDVNAIELINRMYGTNYCYQADKEDWDQELDWPSSDEWGDMIGPKWAYADDFYMDDDGESGFFTLRSAWSVPQPLLEGLAKIITEIKEDCYLIGNYEDEGYEPVGAFLYAKDWDDIEDLDHAYDPQDLWEDDELRDKMWDENSELQSDIESAYEEYLEDRKNNPQDYE